MKFTCEITNDYIIIISIIIVNTSDQYLQERLGFMFTNFIFVALHGVLVHCLGTSTVSLHRRKT